MRNSSTGQRSVRCPVCGRKVRVSNGVLVKHRVDGHVCDNSGCSLEAVERGES